MLSGKDQPSTQLALVDLQTTLEKQFNLYYTYKQTKNALLRQFTVYAPLRVEKMRYSDFQDMMYPRSKQFQNYIKKKQRTTKDSDMIVNLSKKGGVDLCLQTKMMLKKFF